MKKKKSMPVVILVVEDNPTDQLMAKEAFESSSVPCFVHAVPDGEKVFSFLHQEGKYASAPRPDLILLDLNLPRKNGREVLVELKADTRYKSIPVVVVSHSRIEEDVRRCYYDQACCYITKPLDLKSLAEIMGLIHRIWFELSTRAERPPGLTSPPTTSVLPAPGPLPLPAKEVISLLLLEDSPGDAFLLRTALEHSVAMKFQVHMVERLEACVECLADHHYDVILTDLGLPDSEGLETFCRVRDAAVGTPVIVLTGIDSEDTGIAALQKGAQDYLVKGQLNDNELIRVVRHAMERHRLQNQLRQAQRMEVVGRLSGGIAHDFNNILSVVMGQASLLRLERPDDPHLMERASHIIDAAERAANLTRQLLTFSRQNPVQAKPLDFHEVVNHMHRILHRVLGEEIKLVLELCPEPARILADVGMMEQILMNLVVNARDAMPKGGKLRIRTARVEVSEIMARKHNEASPGDYICLIVSDTGTGIPAAILPRIFEPFFSTKEVGKGTGLGLATLFGIVQQHQGWIDVTSTEGKGTAFSIYLPAYDAQIESEAAPPSEEPLKQGHETILVVEDEDSLREVISIILKHQGFHTIVAANGPEALKIWAKEMDRIALVVTDMIMPEGMRGDELVVRLREDRPELRALYTSGYFQGESEAINEKNFLAKPYTSRDLVEAVRRLLDE